MIIDNASTHTPLQAIDHAMKHNLDVMAEPANTSHLVQPNDKIYNLLKDIIGEKAEAIHWLTNEMIKKHHLPVLLVYAIKQGFTIKIVKSAWRNASLMPVNIEKIDKNYIIEDGNESLFYSAFNDIRASNYCHAWAK